MSQVHQTGKTVLNLVMHSVVNAEHQYPSILMHQFMIAIIQKFVLVEGQCILGYLNLDYLNLCLSELTKLVNFLEFHYNLQGGTWPSCNACDLYFNHLYVTCSLHT